MDNKDIIERYYGRRFSRKTGHLFFLWFLAGDDRPSKDSAMKQLWDGTDAPMDDSTIEGLNDLREQISTKPEERFHRMVFWQYAAVVLFLLSVCLGIYIIRSNSIDDDDRMAIVTVPYGQIEELVLPDSTSVSLNGGTVLMYPREFGHRHRNVFLAGEARFVVAKDSERPFNVNSNGMRIKALD